MKVRFVRGFGGAVIGVMGVFAAGCMGTSAPAAPAAHGHAHSHDPGSHNHDRGHMMIASNGIVDAMLTAHLSSKDGNELDVFVERKGEPLALNITKIRAQAEVKGEMRTLDFDCAPRDERPAAEPDDRCSHFVAKAAWMKPGDDVRVATVLPLKSGETAYVWRGFEPKKYAHHIE
jgi:hypothetical protein